MPLVSQMTITKAREYLRKSISEQFINKPAEGIRLMSTMFTKEYHDAIEIDYDTTNVRRIIAKEVPRNGAGEVVFAGTTYENKFIPPVYKKSIAISDAIRPYISLFGGQGDDRVNTTDVLKTLPKVVDLMTNQRDSILDRIEHNIMQNLLTDSIITDTGTYVNNRVAGSLPAMTTAWANVAADIKNDIQLGINFFRSKNLTPTEVDLFVPEVAFEYFLKNTAIKAEADIKQYDTLKFSAPFDKAMGFSVLGYITVGSIRVNIMSHVGTYMDASGVIQRYLPNNKAILMPSNRQTEAFKLMNAAIVIQSHDLSTGMPTLEMRSGQDFYVSQKLDPNNTAYLYNIEASVLPVVKNMNNVYTITIG